MVAKRVNYRSYMYFQALEKLGTKSKDIYDDCCTVYGPNEVHFQ